LNSTTTSLIFNTNFDINLNFYSQHAVNFKLQSGCRRTSDTNSTETTNRPTWPM